MGAEPFCDGGIRSFSDAQTRKRGRPYRVGAPIFHKSNIGDFSGSRRPLKNRGSYCSVSVQTMPIFALNFGTGQRLSFISQQPLDLKVLGAWGDLPNPPPTRSELL